MLVQVLETIAQGGTWSFADLARSVGVEKELLQQMIEHLTRMEYLKPIGEPCQPGCYGCPVAGVCATGGEGQVWGLTGEGAQLLQKMRQPQVQSGGATEALHA